MQIPNNIGLNENSPLAKQLASYQIKFRKWWQERGPSEFLDNEMSLRVPTGKVNGKDWTQCQRMRPNEYTWGIFMSPPDHQHIAFGEMRGQRAWNFVPDEYRTLLFEHITVQADVENAAIEQGRLLTRMAPSQYDLENLFQFYLEEGRHTWAMVHLLLEHFGRDGEDEAEALLKRMSGDADDPRLLDAFNHHTEDWLSHFMWCFLADRVGKYQIQAVTQSAFLPLAAAAKFMMFEEPLHIMFGASGLERILCRSVEVTLREDTHDIFYAGAIPLPVFQKYFNYWASKVYDLFGHDSSNRSNELYRYGIRSPRNFPSEKSESVTIDVREGDQLRQVAAEPSTATNAIMRRQYIAELKRIVDRWNAEFTRCHIDFQLKLPHERFNRKFGPCKGLLFDIDGEPISSDSNASIAEYFPTETESNQLSALMRRELGEGRYTSWIAPSSSRLVNLRRNN